MALVAALAAAPLIGVGRVAAVPTPSPVAEPAPPDAPAEPASAESDPDVRLAPLVDERASPEGAESNEDTEGDESLVPLPPIAPASSRLFQRADLNPYFAEGKLAEAKAAYDRNQPLRARVLLQDSELDAPASKYLAALAALKAGKFAVAAQELDALCESYAVLQDECLFHAGLAHERARDFKGAIHCYAAISGASRPYVEARMSLARLLRRGGDLTGAMDALSPVAFEPSTPATPAQRAAALMLHAEIARQAGAYNAEHRALLAVWSSFPELPEASAAARRLEGTPLLPKARVARAEALLALHQNDEAVAAAQFVLKRLELPDPLACRAQFAVGKALRKERSHAAAIRTLLPVVQRCADAEVRARALFVLGYSQSVLSPPEALKTYDALAAEYPKDPLAAQSLFYAAEMAARLGDVDQALERLERLVSAYPDSAFSPEAVFKWAWLDRKAGDAAKALSVIDRTWSLPPLVTSVDQRARARYWSARWLEDSGQADRSLSELERVIQEAPMTYYGLLARARLELRQPVRATQLLASLDRQVEERWPLDPGPLLSSPRFLAGVELLRLGMPDAEKQLAPIDVKSLPDDSARLLFQVLQTSGFEREARLVVSRVLRASGGGLSGISDFGIWRLAYPSIFEEPIEESSAKAGLDADLLRALIREESAFNPRARSSTGALGLTQLMPGTANKVARLLRWGRLARVSLFNPSRNTRLGAEYISALLRRFENNLVFAVAAYNAGPEAVERWRRDRPDLELDAWVEEIPVEETRGYVKRVLGSYAAYGLARQDRRPEIARAQLRTWLARTR